MAKNQTSFQPGQSGNPKGRPVKDESIAFLIRKFMKKRSIHPKTGKKVPNKQLFVEALFGRSLGVDGDSAAKTMLNYHDGMPVQQLKIEQNGQFDDTLTALREILKKDDDKAKRNLQQKLSGKPV
jgi:hypothetical protein